MLALIDGDIVIHRVGFTTDSDPEWVAEGRCNEMLEGILQATEADEFRIYLSDSRENNFRKHLYPLYKYNRDNKPRPVHLNFLKEFIITEWGALISHGQEADDSLGIDQEEGTTVICSIDKDLLQIPGAHYNFVKNEWSFTSPEEGLVRFYTQMLVGDTSDGIRGCRGIGPVKTKKLFSNVPAVPSELFEVVYSTYLKQEDQLGTEEILNHLLLIGRLLKIRQTEEEMLWNFPRCELMEEAFSEFTQETPEETTQFMERIKQEKTGT